MVLDDVADRAGLLVEGPAAADGDLLGHGDLHRLDRAAVPERLEDRVAEAEGQEVLDGLLAEVVVDPVRLRLGQHRRQGAAELAGAGEVAAEGLLDHHAGPRALVRVPGDQPGLAEVLDDRLEELGGDGEVIEPVALGAVGLVDLGELGLQPLVGGRVVEGAAGEGDVAGELGPGALEVGPPLLGERLLQLAAEGVVGPVAAGDADDGVLRRQVPLAGQPVEGRGELAMEKVAGRAEEHDGAGIDRLAAGQVRAQGIGFDLGRGLGHPATSGAVAVAVRCGGCVVLPAPAALGPRRTPAV